MKKTDTISVSLPIEIVDTLDRIALDSNISRSAVVTAILSILFKWGEEAEATTKKDVLNLLYGKRG